MPRKRIRITQLGSASRGGNLVLQFRKPDGSQHYETITGMLTGPSHGYERRLPDGSDEWQFLSADANGPVAFMWRTSNEEGTDGSGHPRS